MRKPAVNIPHRLPAFLLAHLERWVDASGWIAISERDGKISSRTAALAFLPMPHGLRRRALPLQRTASISLALCFLTGCVVGPRYKVPVPTLETLPGNYKETPAQYRGASGWKIADPKDGLMRGEWWQIFHDPQLNELEAQLNLNNQNIKQSFENFMVARAMIGEEISQYYPTVSGSLSVTRSRSSGNGRGGTVVGVGNTGTGTGTGTTGTGTGTTGTGTTGSGGTGIVGAVSSGVGAATSIMTSIDLAWEPDLWGKIRQAVRSAEYNAQLNAADLANMQLSEQSNLAMYLFEIRGQDALVALYRDTVEADQKALDYTKAQYETGITDKIAMVEATNTLQNAQATLTNLGVNRAAYEHAIAVLVGRVPSNFSVPVRPLKETAPAIPTGVPSQLLERRPDIAAAERTMASDNARIGIAQAAYYPTLNLGGDRGQEAGTFGKLFQVANRLWSVGPSASETLFDGGLRQATIHQYVSTYNADLALYRQTVLTSFQQVEDYLAQVRVLSKQLGQQRDAAQSAQEYVKLETDRYKTGIDPYVDVVTAQTTLLVDQQTAITVQIQQMTGAVLLIKALGGSWDRSQLPTTNEVSRNPSRADAHKKP